MQSYIFNIAITGAVTDNLKYFQYAGTEPTDVQGLAKACAFERHKQLMQDLTGIQTPIDYTVTYGTAGTRNSVPVNPSISLTYFDIGGILYNKLNADSNAGDYANNTTQMITDACNVLAAMVKSSFAKKIYTNSDVSHQYTTSSSITYTQQMYQYIVVPSVTGITVQVTGTYINDPDTAVDHGLENGTDRLSTVSIAGAPTATVSLTF